MNEPVLCGKRELHNLSPVHPAGGWLPVRDRTTCAVLAIICALTHRYKVPSHSGALCEKERTERNLKVCNARRAGAYLWEVCGC